MIKNRKGEVSFVMKLILVLVILAVSIFIYNKITKGSTKVLQCASNGGECVKDTCNWLTQVPALSDKAAGCKSGEICCINITMEEYIDPDCEGKSFGDQCRIDESPQYYCGLGEHPRCISRCEFCAKGGAGSEKKNICGTDIQKEIFLNPPEGKVFNCECAASECTGEDIKKGLCMPGFCPSKTDTDPNYMCCIRELVIENTE